MALDPNKPVYIIKAVPYGSGSIYPVGDRPYNIEQIPPKFRTEDYLKQEAGDRFKEYVQPPVAPPLLPTNLPDYSRLDVNTATSEQLTSLPGVGKATAEVLIDERSKVPFTSLEDLDTRVPLRGGAKWAEQMKGSVRI